MQSDAKVSGEGATLAAEHKELLGRLPATVHAFILAELHKWPVLFAPEQRYQRALLRHLSGLPAAELAKASGGIARIEADAGISRLSRRDPARLQEDAQGLLRKRRLVALWRKEIDGFFQQIDPALETQLYPSDAPRRLVVQIYGAGIAVQAGNLWSRFKDAGTRIPLKLEATAEPQAFLGALFGRSSEADRSPELISAAARAGLSAADCWIVESHQALHDLLDESSGPEQRPSRSFTGVSYDRLRAYRDELMRSLYSKILSGVESPQAFAAYARSLKVAPGTDALVTSSEAVQAFVRDVFLTGNGTLFVNNTFAEWATVQALRRAQPRVLVTRFGVRDKLKPFSSLLLFSQPRASDQIPMIEDPVGSFVDVEQLSYYVWLNAEKGPAYRNKTLYLFLAEGIDEMLAIRSDKTESSVGPPSTLADICATMIRWLDLPAASGAGQPIASLVS